MSRSNDPARIIEDTIEKNKKDQVMFLRELVRTPSPINSRFIVEAGYRTLLYTIYHFLSFRT